MRIAISRISATFLLLGVFLSAGTAQAQSFSDVPSSSWFAEAVTTLAQAGHLDIEKEEYRPEENANRAEFIKLVVELNGGVLTTTPEDASFDDSDRSAWYHEFLEEAAREGWVTGDNSCFGSRPCTVRPADSISRAEAAAVIVRAFGLEKLDVAPQFADNPSSQWYHEVIQTSADHCLLQGDDRSGRVRPAGLLNRAEMAVLFDRLDKNLTYGEGCGVVADASDDDDEEITEEPLPPSEGELEITLAPHTPTGDTLPRGAQGVVMLSLDLTASCTDEIIIENMTILHEGFGDEQDIDGLYAAISGARVTRKRTIDSEDQTADLRFSSPLVLNPCETVTLDIVADFSSAAAISAEHRLVVELPSDIVTNAEDLTGAFPLRGEGFQIAAVTSGVVTLEYRTVSPDEVEVGDQAVVIGKFEISVDSVEDQTLYSLTLEQNSSASDGDAVNIAIRRTDGTVLSNTVTQTVGDFVTLVFDPPFTVLEGDKITLEVIADITGGAGDSIIMHFEESSDIFAVGSLYGYGVNGQLYGSQVTLPAESSDLPDTVTIDAGEFTIGIDGPATQDYTSDDTDAVLGLINFQTGGEDIDIKDMFIALQGQTSTGSALESITTGSFDEIREVLEDVEIRNRATGRTIEGVRLTGSSDSGVATAGTFQIYRFDDFVIRGDEEWELRVNFIDNGSTNHPRNGDKFRMHVCGEPTHILSNGALTTNTTGCSFGGLIASSTSYQMQVEGLSTGDKVGDVRPRGNIAGNFHQVKTATLTIQGRELAVSSSVVENAKKKGLIRFEAYASEAEDILITDLVFESANQFSLVNGQNYTLWVDTDGDGNVDTILQEGVASQTETITFNDLVGGGYVIPRETSVIFEVKADISSSLVGTNPELLIRFNTGAVFVSAEELDDGSSLSGIRTRNPGNAVVGDNGSYTDGGSNAQIQVKTAPGIRRKLRTNGNLFVTEDSTPVRNHQLLGGTLTDDLLRITFLARRENVDVTDIVITAAGTDASSFTQNIDRLMLYRSGETEAFAEATVAGCGSDGVAANSMCANMENQQLVLKKDRDTDVIVRAKMSTDSDGALSGKQFSLTLDPTPSTTSGAVRARGADSSNDLLQNDEDTSEDGEVFIGRSDAGANVTITGTTHQTVLAKITSIVNANTDANGSAIPTGISSIGSFRITAAEHGNSKNGLNDVVLSGAVFNVNATNVSIDPSSFKVYNSENPNDGNKAGCTAYNATNTGVILAGSVASGSLLIECKGLDSNGVIDTVIDNGEDMTLVLEADVTDPSNSPSGGNSTLQVSLTRFNSQSNTGFGLKNTSGFSHIQWLDRDTSTTSFTWIDSDQSTIKSTSYAN